MELKKYQHNSIDKIKNFLKDLDKEKPEFAFMHLTKLILVGLFCQVHK